MTSPPITKTFRGHDMLSALHQVQQEFGADAIVVSMREVPGGAAWQIWRKPIFEVVAMKNPSSPLSEGNATQPATPQRGDRIIESAQNPIPVQGSRSSPWQTPSKEPRTSPLDILLQISREAPSPSSQAHITSSSQFEALPTALSAIRQQLEDQGVDASIIQWSLNAARLGLPPEAQENETKARLFILRHLEGGIRVSPPPPEQLQGLLFISGLSGSGKTSLCARLAAYATRVLQRRVAWITLDTVRTAALNEARTFADLLGIALQIAYTPEEFRQHLHGNAGSYDLTLVDTPALNPQSEEGLLWLASFLNEAPRRKLYLTLPATAKESDLHHLINVLSPFHVQGLVFTKLDETLTLGNLYNLAWKTQIPIAFFMQGRRVLDDLHPAVASRLVKSLIGEVQL